MPIAIIGVKLYLIVTHGVRLYALYLHGVKIYAHCYTWCEAYCSECTFMLIAIQEVKFYAHCYSWSEALCPWLYMELVHME